MPFIIDGKYNTKYLIGTFFVYCLLYYKYTLYLDINKLIIYVLKHTFNGYFYQLWVIANCQVV